MLLARQAFQRGVQALAQWVEREGADRAVPRGHSEQITVDGKTEPVAVKLGVWVSNTKSRRDKLSAEQLATLVELSVDWAGAPPKQAAPAPTDNGPAQPHVTGGADAGAPRPPRRHADGRRERSRGGSRPGPHAASHRTNAQTHQGRTAAHGIRGRPGEHHNSPEKWRKDEIAAAVADCEQAPP
ncbi:helicase associated domain-containing protein [Streptomyces geranii]|uniref:helicase associated domain-containing protein n=1 Tax=Streptomyces geranii TaxID=2058923 RepID=UPI0038CDA718